MKDLLKDLEEGGRPTNPDGSKQIIMELLDGRGDMVQIAHNTWAPLTPFHIEHKTLEEMANLSFGQYQELMEKKGIRGGYNYNHKYISPGKVEKIDD